MSRHPARFPWAYLISTAVIVASVAYLAWVAGSEIVRVMSYP